MVKAIIITSELKRLINEFLGAELIPGCAIGNQLVYSDGSLVVETFKNDGTKGYRRLDLSGDITNIITESMGNQS